LGMGGRFGAVVVDVGVGRVLGWGGWGLVLSGV